MPHPEFGLEILVSCSRQWLTTLSLMLPLHPGSEQQLCGALMMIIYLHHWTLLSLAETGQVDRLAASHIKYNQVLLYNTYKFKP